ncbi:hypothetical protein PAHAL_6G309500 [Panicum hallii]|uniref:Exocyst component Exo84 C-terminal domain-containing protein n=1 Tax=Panicum hallii TaxID=206008 RepID=A0A2S3I4W4_9POAL|nr:exocyst complex component EXO84A-like [Panicum hallii]PAN36773.1 hypothetical protein PAHAL_6G309500 [Panicum hallii]
MASLRRHRRGGIAEAEDDYDDDDVHDDGSGTASPDIDDTATEQEEEEEDEEEEDYRLHLGLHSMTAKGIQHLCSELLEIKKASEQDFRANVYLSYLSFIRMLQEAGDLDKDVHRLKHQVIAHSRMIQHVSSNCCLLLAGSKDEDEADMGHDDEELELELELDVLLSEHRMEEALELLQRQQGGCTANDAALSARKARVADRLASVAGNPRTPRPELLKALSGLCRLGDPERANHLLFSSYRSASVEGLSSQQAAAGHYIKDLARMVFSSIADASRCFVALHGHPSPYTPQLRRWAREEMEDFSAAFSEYVRSMPPSPSLALALEAAACAVSYSSLLRPLGIASEQDVAGLMAPCIREVLDAYGRHLKEVVRLLVASDASWVLGRFLLMPAQAAAAAGEHRYCLLTASGRKFVTLVQEVVDGVACPLQSLGLGMDDDAAQLVADLFREYVRSIIDLLEEELIIPSFPNKKEAADDDEQQYMWQLSVLVNCSTLVSLLPTMAWTASAQRQVGSLIKEAAGQVWSCFCQQFIRGTMAMAALPAPPHQVAEEGGTPPAAAPPEMMPSLAFQAVFLRVRRLKDAYGGGILSGDDGTMKELLQELMEALISWLSSNPPESWIGHGAQAQLDVHFLLEIAQLGGFDITASARELLRRAAAAAENGGEEGWAADAAKHAVHQVLLLQQQQQNMTTSSASLNEEEEGGEEAAVAEDATEEFESEFDDMPSSRDSAAAHQGYEDAKSSDEFVSIEEADEEKHSMLMLTVGCDDSDSRRRRQATPVPVTAAAPPRARRSRKKAAAGSSRPRWQ